MHSTETETYIMLCFLLPITWSISRLFHLSVTYVGITLLFQHPVEAFHFHIHMNYAPQIDVLWCLRARQEMGPGGFHTAKLHQSPSSFRSQRGSSFTHESSRQTTATRMRAIPLRGPSTLGLKKEGLSEANSEGSVAAIHRHLREEGMSTADNHSTFSPCSCLIIMKLQPGGNCQRDST